MDLTRRGFLKFTAAAGTVGITNASKSVRAEHRKPVSPDWLGVLVDTTVCIGCRKCEWACKDFHNLPTEPIDKYENKAVFKKVRRPDAEGYTVVNSYDNPNNPEKPYYVKVQCMHCNDAACVSACIVGAFTKDERTGAVIYDAWKCIGCRYCMAACPFQIPAYEYQNALTPQIRKCNLCFSNLSKYRKQPACVAICPMETMIFGKRSELIKIAHDRIRKYPERYVDHVYGEHELGGTSWLYLSGKPMWEMHFKHYDEKPIPAYTETIQHSLFKNFLPPLALFSMLGSLMWIFKRQEQREKKQNNQEGGGK
ncbi:4Fe-4S dicluster domain-containing protein [candidate division KSB1 bacterium]|nr:4Fe-4S dicluster domain-containing protein [candidate division KSB1 bacterium]